MLSSSRTRLLLAVAVAFASLAIAPLSADAAPKLSLTVRATRGSKVGLARVAAVPSERVRSIAFYVDGRRTRLLRVKRAARNGLRGYLNTRRLTAGRHVVTARAVTRASRRTTRASKRVVLHTRKRREATAPQPPATDGNTRSGSGREQTGAGDGGQAGGQPPQDGSGAEEHGTGGGPSGSDRPGEQQPGDSGQGGGEQPADGQSGSDQPSDGQDGGEQPGSDDGAAPESSAEAMYGPTIFADDFSIGSKAPWNDAQAMTADRIQNVPAPGGRTGYAGRFEVRNGDRGFPGDYDSRAELAWWSYLAGEGHVVTYSWSTYFPADFPIESAWQDIAQWKNEGTGTPPLQIGLSNGRLGMTAGSQFGYRTIWGAPLTRGAWHTFVVTLRFSENAKDGSVDLTFDGKKMLDRYHLPTLYKGLKNYFKIGLYRSHTIQPTQVVYHSDLTIRRSR